MHFQIVLTKIIRYLELFGINFSNKLFKKSSEIKVNIGNVVDKQLN